MPTVSIIMPCHNNALMIGEAIASVVSQTLIDWELLICDDESSDNSLDIAETWSSKDERIIVLKNRFKKGAPGARNTSLTAASGKYIAFLDADDVWYPQKLEKQIHHMEETGNLFCLSYYDVMNELGEHSHYVRTPSDISYRLMMYSNFIPCLTAIYNSDILGKVAQPNIRKRNDYALWLTLFEKQGLKNASAVTEVLASYRQNSYGLSSSAKDSLKYYFICLRQYANRSYVAALYFSSMYLLIVLLKKKAPSLYNYLVSRM